MAHFATRLAVAIDFAIVAAGACLVVGSCRSAPVAGEDRFGGSSSIDPKPPVEGGVPVRVVDAKSGEPVASAIVFAVDEHDFSYGFSEPELADVDTSTVLREIGTAYLTDARGATRIAAADAPQSLFAWHHGAFGRATLEARDGAEQVIAIAPRTLDVEVVDGNGRPQAGVPVVLGACAGEVGGPGACRTVTGADGRATFEAIDLERSVHRTCGRRALVMLGFPCDLHAFRAIDAPVLEPVRFTLPDCGELLVDLVDEAGAPLTRAAVADLHARLALRSTAWQESAAVAASNQVEESQLAFVDVDEVPVRVPRVSLGRDLSLTLWVRTSDGADDAATRHYTAFASGDDESELRGPERAGAIVRARLAVPLQEVADARSERHGAPPEPRPSVASAPGPVDESTPSSVAVRVLLDTPIEPCELRVRWRDDDAPGAPFAGNTLLGDIAWIDVTGRTTVRDVLPGTWTFGITATRRDAQSEEVVLALIPHVDVPPGRHVRDPRLLAIDLRGALRIESR